MPVPSEATFLVRIGLNECAPSIVNSNGTKSSCSLRVTGPHSVDLNCFFSLTHLISDVNIKSPSAEMARCRKFICWEEAICPRKEIFPLESRKAIDCWWRAPPAVAPCKSFGSEFTIHPSIQVIRIYCHWVPIFRQLALLMTPSSVICETSPTQVSRFSPVNDNAFSFCSTFWEAWQNGRTADELWVRRTGQMKKFHLNSPQNQPMTT